MKRILTSLAAVLAACVTVFAQGGYQVKGVVVDAMGPVIGATVLEQGTTNGTSTGLDGDYTITVSGPNAVIEISCIGYATQTFTAKSVPATITLEEDTHFLDEVVVIGYGTVKKNDMTGSVTAIKTEEVNRGAIVSTQDMLKGKVAGLQVIPGDGRPGSGSTLRVRGAASLNASNDPLVVIDGVPLASNGGEGMTNPLASINPNDIESFTVLKDASSAAIYGSRASNGVIIITTKKGSISKDPKISYVGNFGVSHNANRLDTMTADEYRSFVAQVYPVGTPNGDAFAARLGTASTDWRGLIFRTAFTHEHNLSAYGSMGNLPYRLSLGYLNQQGTLQKSMYRKGTLDFSLSPSFLDNHLSLNLNAKGVVSLENKADGGAVGTATFFNPTLDPYFRNPDGSIDYTTTNGYFNYGNGRGAGFTPDMLAPSNPLDMIYGNRDDADAYRFIGNAQLDYKIHGFEALRFNLNLGMDVSFTRGQVGSLPSSFNAYKDTENPRIGQFDQWSHLRRNTLLEFYADFNKEFGKHHVDVMAGYSWQHFYGKDRDVYFFNETGKVKLNEGETIDSRYPFWQTENYLVSFYGRANYSYDSRYLLTVTVRYDGSSRFSPATRWGLFPSAAFAWNIRQEHFLREQNTLSTLKLRLSWGETGQQEIGANYPYLAAYSLSTDVYHTYNMGSAGQTFYLTPGAYDPNIKWETTTTYNAGLDFGFINDRILGSVDVYRRDTKDLLNTVLTPMGANFGNSLLTNIGSMRNEGVELSLNVIPVETKDVSLSLGVNGTFQRTKFTKLNNTDDPNYAINVSGISGGLGNTIARHMVGYAPFTFYPYQQVYDHTGKPIQNAFVDRDKDGVITTADRYMSGKSPNPDFFYGVNLKFTFKNFDLGFNGHGSVGNWVFNNVKGDNSSANFVAANNFVSNYLNYVKSTGFMGTNSIEQYSTDLFLEDASFFRMDDINLGYTFPKFKKWEKASLRLGLSVQNVFVLTRYSGLDPEIPGSNGVDSSIWPRPRTYSLRVNLNF